MSILEEAYDATVRLLRTVSPLAARGSSKLARGIRGRSDAARSLKGWGAIHRDPARALVWSHAPSVGEGLQARAVLEALLHMRPDIQSAFTFFSPSAVALAESMPVHVASYLPWDVRADLEEVIDVVRPTLVSFTKTEVWPGLTAAAASRGVPVVLTAATLSEGAGRLKPLARRLLEPAFRTLDRVFAIADADAERFELLGVHPDRIRVTGDPGIDSAWQRARETDPEAGHLVPFRGVDGPILVAGSTWPADEDVLVPALEELRRSRPGVVVVIAPHEPMQSHLVPLETRLAEGGYRVERLGVVESRGTLDDTTAVVVDRVGVLAQLYTIGSMAYVGGGFHDEGLHSVLEPAAAAVPTCFGPRHESSRAAVDLAESGGGRPVGDAAELHDLLASWIDGPAVAEEIGSRASGYIAQHRGAAMRTARALADYISTDDR